MSAYRAAVAERRQGVYYYENMLLESQIERIFTVFVFFFVRCEMKFRDEHEKEEDVIMESYIPILEEYKIICIASMFGQGYMKGMTIT